MVTCTTVVQGDGGRGGCVIYGAGGIWKLSGFAIQFVCGLNVVEKIKSILKK